MMIAMKVKKIREPCQVQSGLRVNAVNLFEEYHFSDQPDLGISL